MTGGTGRGARGWRPGAALAGLLALVFLMIGRGAIPFPEASIPIVLPREFWSLLALVLVLGYLGYYTMVMASPSPAARKVSGIFTDKAQFPETESMPEPEVEVPTGHAGTAQSRPAGATTAKTETEMSKLIEWLEGVSVQIAQWGSDVHTSRHDEPPHVEETQPSTILVETVREPEPLRSGAWTELRARKAIQKYLRRQPWAPATDIAKALHMEVGLATRVADSLREGFE